MLTRKPSKAIGVAAALQCFVRRCEVPMQEVQARSACALPSKSEPSFSQAIRKWLAASKFSNCTYLSRTAFFFYRSRGLPPPSPRLPLRSASPEEGILPRASNATLLIAGLAIFLTCRLFFRSRGLRFLDPCLPLRSAFPAEGFLPRAPNAPLLGAC